MLASRLNRFHWTLATQANIDTFGVSVTPGASNAEGSWTALWSSSDVAHDVYELWIWVSNGFSTGAARPHLLDVGVDPAGGTSYSVLIENIACGQSSPLGYYFRFPIFIPAGSSIAVRVQGTNATAGTVFVGGWLHGLPDRPDMIRTASFADTIGTVSGSGGQSVTEGSNGAMGSWVDLGATSRDLWWWQLAIGLNDSSMTNNHANYDLAYGDASNKILILERTLYGNHTTFEDFAAGPHNFSPQCYCEVPAGSNIYVRGANNQGAANTVTALAIGLGG